VATDGPSRDYSATTSSRQRVRPVAHRRQSRRYRQRRPYPSYRHSVSRRRMKKCLPQRVLDECGQRGAASQQARLAGTGCATSSIWISRVQRTLRPDGRARITVSVTNSGSGHNFPPGFQRGASPGSRSQRSTSPPEESSQSTILSGTDIDRIGRLTGMDDRSVFPRCGWKVPAGSPDPYAYQFKAVATLGDDCPRWSSSTRRAQPGDEREGASH